MIKRFTAIGVAVMMFATAFPGATAQSKSQKEGSAKDNLRVLYWNIQNGMWDGQPDNYDRFVEFVASQKPDVCVWCEAGTIYKDNTAEAISDSDRYLPDHWGELAARYGHKYWYMGAHRDNYPQVITSKYPIKGIARISGEEPDSVVCHGAGWAQIKKNGNVLNIVTLHTWPHGHRPGLPYDAEVMKASAENHEGTRYRLMEVEYICNHTINTVPDADRQLWMMLGDFNSRSILDNHYYNYDPVWPDFWVHNYILQETPYVDVIAETYPGEYKESSVWDARLDYIYCTPPLMERVKYADIIRDSYTEPVRNPMNLSNFWHPSDHCPIVVDFDMKKVRKSGK